MSNRKLKVERHRRDAIPKFRERSEDGVWLESDDEGNCGPFELDMLEVLKYVIDDDHHLFQVSASSLFAKDLQKIRAAIERVLQEAQDNE